MAIGAPTPSCGAADARPSQRWAAPVGEIEVGQRDAGHADALARRLDLAVPGAGGVFAGVAVLAVEHIQVLAAGHGRRVADAAGKM